VLPEDHSFNLLSADRKTLNLPHGGLVRRDGAEAEIGDGNLSVAVAASRLPPSPTRRRPARSAPTGSPERSNSARRCRPRAWW